MTRIPEHDLRLALDVLSEIQCAADLDDFRARVVRVGDLIPSNVVGYNEVEVETGETHAVIDPPEAAFPDVEDVFARVAHEHPVIAHFQRTGDPGPHALSDFLSEDELHGLALYRDVWKPMGVEDQISFILPTPPRVVVGLAINRGKRGFSLRERELIRLVQPHLGRAFEAASIRTTAGKAQSLLETASASAGHAVIVLGAAGAIATASPEALSWLGLDGASLPAAVSTWVESCRLRIADRREGQEPLDYYGVRIDFHPAAGPMERDMLLLERRVDPVSDDRLTALGLTRRESEVMRLLVDGQTTEGVAESLSISPHTAHRHIRNAYSKLGVRSRAAAVAKVLGG